MNRRTLYRVLAVVVALAAISPLLLDLGGGLQQLPSHVAVPDPTGCAGFLGAGDPAARFGIAPPPLTFTRFPH